MAVGGGGDRCEETTSRRRSGSTCWGRCGSWSTACRSTCAGRSVVPCSRCWPWQSGRAVTADHLVDALWPSAAPESGRAALHSHVSRLRGHLGPGAERLITLDGGYRLALDRRRAGRGAGAGPADRGPRDPPRATRQRRAPCCARHWRSGAVRPSPTSPTSRLCRPWRMGLERLHREVTDLLIECAIDAGQRRRVGPARRRGAGRRPAARTSRPAADARPGGDRAGA